MTVIKLKVAVVAAETALIRRLDLVAVDGRLLPGFSAGSHITLHLPGIGIRKYSLINTDATPGATTAPEHYTLGVRLEATGGGGSRAIHNLKTGDTLIAEPPKNDFPLAADTVPPLLIAGGIGVTPLIAMAAELKAADRPFRFIYAVRSRSDIAFRDAIEALAGPAVTWHVDDEAGAVINMAALLAECRVGEPVYACGPRPMLKAAIGASRRLGWAPGRLRFELFYAASTDAKPAQA